MYFHPARPPRTEKCRISTTRWQNSPHPTPNPGQIGFKMAKAAAAAPAASREDRPQGAAGARLVRLFGSGGWILQQKTSGKPVGATASSDTTSTSGGEVGLLLTLLGGAARARVPPNQLAAARCMRWVPGEPCPQLALGHLLPSALAVLPVPRTITHSAPQYISHCISCLIWQQN